MSLVLDTINGHLARFSAGQIGIEQMWSDIESDLRRWLKDDNDSADPYEDDKAEQYSPRPPAAPTIIPANSGI